MIARARRAQLVAGEGLQSAKAQRHGLLVGIAAALRKASPPGRDRLEEEGSGDERADRDRPVAGLNPA
jgi:hypothetical protein